MEGRLAELEKMGKALASLGKSFSVIASGDFTHQEPLEIASEKDHSAIKKIEAMDIEGFNNEVRIKNLSICGVSPITVAMYYGLETGIKKGKLLKYDTSATFSKNEASVVGYASITLK